MKKEDLKFYIIFFGIIAFIVFVMDIIEEINYNRFIKKNIEDEYRAIVIEKFNPRKNMKEATFVRIRKNNKKNNNTETLAPGTEIMDYISIGDSLIKIKDENICYVKKLNGEIKRFYYVRISMKRRSHWTFPKEWKDKWMESSAWDTLR